MAEFLPPVVVELVASIKEFQAKMGEAKAELTEFEAQSNTSFANFKKYALVGGAVAAAALVGGIALSVKAYNEDQNAQVRLQAALKNTHDDNEEVRKSIELASESMRKYGFTNADVANAMGTMVTAVGSAKKAQDLLAVSADLAAYKHVSLAEAGLAVSRASEGNIKALKAMGIDLGISSTSAAALTKAHDGLSAAQKKFTDLQKSSTATHTQLVNAQEKVIAAQKKYNDASTAGQKIVEGLTNRLKGQADAAAGTFTGAMKALGASVEEVFVKFGEKLSPAINWFSSQVTNLTGWLMEHQAVLNTIAAVIGGVLVTAIGLATAALIANLYAWTATQIATLKTAAAWAIAKADLIAFYIQYAIFEATQIAGTIATGIATAAQWAWNAAVYAFPGTWIVLAIAGVVAAIILLWKNSEAVGSVLSSVWEGIKTGVSAMWGVVKNIFALWVQGWFWVIGMVLDGAVKMFGWVPGIGDKLKAADDAFHKFADGVIAKLKGTDVPSGKAGEKTGTSFVNGFKKATGDPTTVASLQTAGKSFGIALATGANAALPDAKAANTAILTSLVKDSPYFLAMAQQTGKELGVTIADGAVAVAGYTGMTAAEKAARGIASSLVTATVAAVKKHTNDTPPDLTGAGSAAAKTVLKKGAEFWAGGFVAEAKGVLQEGTGELFSNLSTLLTNFGNKVKNTGQVSIDQFQNLASAIKDKLNTALQSANDQLQKAKDAFNAYRDAISGGVSSGNNLSDAAQKQSDAIQAVADATKAHNDALQSLQDTIKKGDDQTDAKKQVDETQAALDKANANQQSFLGFLQTGADTATVFAGQIDQLTKSTNSLELVQQIAALGAQTGGRIITELMSGGQAAIDKASQLVDTVKNVGVRVGTVAAEKFFQAGVDSANALVRGLYSQLDELQTVLDKYAKMLSDKLGGAAINVSLGDSAGGGSIPAPAAAYTPAPYTPVSYAGMSWSGFDTNAYIQQMQNSAPASNNITVNAQTNADANSIANEIAWAMAVGVA